MKASGKIRIFLLVLLVCTILIVLGFSWNNAIGNSIHGSLELSVTNMDTYTREFVSDIPIIVVRTTVSSLYESDTPPLAMVWLFDGEGENRLTDNPTAVFETATANYRGTTSISFPKKGYSLDLYNQVFLDPLDYPFFGFAPASNWVLRTPYADKSLLRDWFSQEIAATVLDWQPRGTPVQLFIQDGENSPIEYEGVYFFTEKITVGEGRLELGELTLNSSATIDYNGGGYVIQKDRPRPNSFALTDYFIVRHVYPTPGNMTSHQDANLRHEIEFYMHLLGRRGRFDGIADEYWDYESYIDVDSFINNFLVAELLKNNDMGVFSAFYHRAVGGKFTAGPMWDFDISMGNMDFSDNIYYDTFFSPNRALFWYLLHDEAFVARYVSRWYELRETIWTDEFIFGMFDSMTEYLSSAAAQNAERWPEKYDGETYIWPNRAPFTQSWEEEIERTRSWLVSRVRWLDENMINHFGTIFE